MSHKFHSSHVNASLVRKKPSLSFFVVSKILERVDGTSHLHLIAAMKCVAPMKMAECFGNDVVKNKLEEWIGNLFCENNSHPEGGLLRVMEENGKLLHVHTLLCSKYQKTNTKGKCRCRFEFGRPLCKP